ncbi:hypothetical protein LQG66_27820 [Bradyrhizobium ontarionense]|uniref:Uncharacterized protein n=1 Tax=Bradyrhizobium ontarionense TaxID=2898149 RepID=A0ABY3R7V3_9BRAD|nr:hypothetical protein [Bradyrhizobium sp. A19]UFZ03029.1 hypothetical protein LQG66_27820 [Bradyrhizobium sp. A19]
MSNEVLRFELRRQSDDLVYGFTRMTRADGSVGFKRADGDYWNVWKPDWGWVAWNDSSQTCMGRPWHVLPRDQGGSRRSTARGRLGQRQGPEVLRLQFDPSPMTRAMRRLRLYVVRLVDDPRGLCVIAG